MSFECVKTSRTNKVGRITLARENVRNAQNTQMLTELDAALQTFVADETINVIILGAEGPHFSAGHDVKEGKDRVANITVEQRWAYEEKYYFDYCMNIFECPKPTIAEVRGGCIAGGFMIANVCDLIVAAESAYFSDPVVHRLSAVATEVLIHPWVMNIRKAKEMLFTGEPISARDALQLGIVNKVVPDTELADATMAMAEKISAAPPFAIRLTKRSLNRVLEGQGMRSALQAHFDTHQLSHRTEEYMKMRAAGVEKAIPAKAKP